MIYDKIGNGEPLILIHGFGENRKSWIYQYPLAKNFELIIPELRGHGENNCYDNITFENLALDVLSLMKKLNIQKAHICGLSMGGVVVQEMYKISPEKFKTLILANTYHYTPLFISDLIKFFRLYTAISLPKPLRLEMTLLTTLSTYKKEVIQRFYKIYNPNLKGYIETLKSFKNFNNTELLEKIEVPTLIIGANNDIITPLHFQREMKRLIPNSELYIFNRGGHLVKIEKPVEFNNVISNFLLKHVERSL